MATVPATAIPLAALAAGACGVGYAWLEARHFSLREFTIPVLPVGAGPLRVLHLSDLHLVPRQGRKQRWLAGLADLEPDLVVSTGDNLAALDAVPAVLAAHGRLLERPGVFVLGSNDYFAPQFKSPARYLLRNGGKRRSHGRRLPSAELVQGFTAAGWLDLTNRRGRLQVAGADLEFVGVDDPHLNYDRYDETAGAADPDATLTVGVTHAPYQRVLNAMSADGAGLLLAGHTHGGQLCLPGFGTLVTNCDVPRRQAKGVSRWPVNGAGAASSDALSSSDAVSSSDAAWMHVSAGLGTAPSMAVRLACRPEASLLTLVAKPT